MYVARQDTEVRRPTKPGPRRTPDEIRTMRRAGRVVAEMHERLRAAIKPGVTTQQLDGLARVVLSQAGATSNFLGYHGYPAVICASVNDVVVHGIPNDVPLQEGDIVSIDCGAVVDGYHGDAAFTAGVGQVSPKTQNLIDVTRRALDAAIKEMVAGNRLGDLGSAVQVTVERAGFDVVRDYVGHGIGTAMHEPPDVPNYGRPGRGKRLAVGDVLAVEPMVCAGSADTRVLDDGWTVVTVDGSLAAHWEHTIAITDDGPQVLTLP
jgi:methionyl aminopeptidase